MSRMPLSISLHIEYGQCSFCGAEDVEITPLSEVVTPTTDKEELWICSDCLSEDFGMTF